MDLAKLPEPIVQAPMAGGVSTVELAAAVGEAGGLGFLAAGYRTAEELREQIRRLRALTRAPFGVNVLAPPGPPPDAAALARYASRLAAEADRYGAELGEPRHDDDDIAAKLAVARAERVAVVSFTFGCPHRDEVARLHDAGCDVWVTVTDPAEASEARGAGADALVVQGVEAGGHRASFTDASEPDGLGLLPALRLIADRVELPLIAAGGLTDGAAVAAALCAGAVAAQVGTALLLTPEAGTSPPHRAALSTGAPTGLSRAFTGRRGRSIVNRFMDEHGAHAPAAYPDVHHLTAPLRAAAREAGDPQAINLWAGQAYPLAREQPAAEVVRDLGAQARAAARRLAQRLG